MMNYVKKLMVLFLIGISCIGLLGASIWEGAAAMAAGGELPEKGYYIATNSFPRNTMVDVVNLENGKTLLAIVVGGIDTPGLLGLLSAEAAAALGLEKGMVGRIRVHMPADPIAFSRYMNELSKTGDPDRDPVAALSLPQSEEPPASVAVAVVEEKPAESAQESASEQTAAAEENTSSAQTAPSVEEAPVALNADIEQSQTLTSTAEELPKPEDENIQELPEFTQKSLAEPAPLEPPAPPTEETIPEVTGLADTLAVQPEAPLVEPTAEEAAPTVSPPMEAPDPGSVVLSLEPAEERPPVGVSAETVAPADVPAAKKAEPITEIPEAPGLVIKEAEESPLTVPEPISPPVPETVVVSEPVPPRTPEPTALPIAEKVEEPQVVPKPEAKPETSTVPVKVTFSVPVVTNLTKGKYYIQLGAFSKVETVESQIKQLNKQYPLLVQVVGTPEKPMYRLIIGPLNEGESGALVSYFKKSGYKDAFVKKEI